MSQLTYLLQRSSLNRCLHKLCPLNQQGLHVSQLQVQVSSCQHQFLCTNSATFFISLVSSGPRRTPSVPYSRVSRASFASSNVYRCYYLDILSLEFCYDVLKWYYCPVLTKKNQVIGNLS